MIRVTLIDRRRPSSVIHLSPSRSTLMHGRSTAGQNSASGLYSLDGRGGGPSDGVRRHAFRYRDDRLTGESDT